MLASALLIAAFAATPAPLTDCGEKHYKRIIAATNRLTINRADLEIPEEITELPKPGGTAECVRLVFDISKDGRAKNISIRESSRNFDLNVAAIHALKGYRFRPTKPEKDARYSLIFRKIMNIAPAPTSSSGPGTD